MVWIVDMFDAFFLAMLGLDQNDMSRKTLDIYKKYFEDRFIQSTRQYYAAESEKFIAENSVTDYMRKAEARLKVSFVYMLGNSIDLIFFCQTGRRSSSGNVFGPKYNETTDCCL